jgi:hypothetical protein
VRHAGHVLGQVACGSDGEGFLFEEGVDELGDLGLAIAFWDELAAVLEMGQGGSEATLAVNEPVKI